MVNREGWTCPTCRRNYAPWVPSCNCINSTVGVNTTSITITPHADDAAAEERGAHRLLALPSSDEEARDA